jgi:hypothetical protein
MGDKSMNDTSIFISAVINLCGGSWFVLEGDDAYENIKCWYVGNGNLTDESKIPTKEQVLAEVERIKKEEVYKRQRTGEMVDGVVTTDTIYPDWGTQLDYIYHHGIDKWKTDIVDPVKNKYPKPS